MEIEIHRIAKLQEPARTEQALRCLLRYRDAEAIVVAVSKMRAGDVAAMEIKRLSNNYKRKLARIAGIDGLANDNETTLVRVPAPVQAPQPSPRSSRSPSSERVPEVLPAGSSRTRRQSAGR
jgi:hypothetical protein